MNAVRCRPRRFLDENNLEQDHLDDVATFVERHCGTPTLEFSAPRATPTVPGAYVPGSGGTAPPPTAPTYTSRRPVVPGAYVPGGATARVQTHDFPQEEFVYLAAVKLDGLRRKLEEFNADVSDPELALNVGEMTVLFKGWWLRYIMLTPASAYPHWCLVDDTQYRGIIS
eukprot:m.87136 g.87136  ORF g.87136 m.87136 type:complete len:170 (-) comp16396_c1_seq2:1115-1624(-)